MLSLLRIQNFALIDELELDFSSGLNVLTGETGAGKSIILDALDVALGGRVSQRMIRQGKEKALVEANFLPNMAVKEWLQQQEIELLDDGSVVCCRELANKKGSLRSRVRVNGVLVNRPLMSQLRDRLVEITAQGQTVQLMIPSKQRDLLDLYGGQSLLKQRELVADAYEIAQKADETLEYRRQSEQQRLQRLDLVTYQIKELESAHLNKADELENLEQESDRLSNVVELQQLSNQVYQSLYQNEQDGMAASDLLAQVESMLLDMVNYDKSLESVLEMVRTAITQVVEAGSQIYSYGADLEADPERLGEIETRIQILKRICRKYGPTLAEAIAYYEKLQAELAELTDTGQSLEQLEKEYQICEQKLVEVCTKLTELRQQAATKLEEQLIKELKPLAMDKVTFACRIQPCSPNIAGADEVAFYFSPNPGEEIQPLSYTASGGEMSRFLLALKACFSNSEKEVSTLIFDEIDAGVSGKVAQAIALKLHQLSCKNQLLCVTHQPLIAAMADAHFRVEKQLITENKDTNDHHNSNGTEIRTVVRVTNLDNHNTRREELAQLTGGHSAQEAIAFAESILEMATQHKKTR